MNRELDLVLQMRESVLLQWKQHPLQLVNGIEVFENFRVDNKGMEDEYKLVRQDIIDPPVNKFVTIEALARSGIAKGSRLMAYRRLLSSDEYLQESLKASGVKLEIVPLVFALYASVAQSKEILEKYPNLYVPPYLKHGEFTANHYRSITTLEWMDVEKWIDFAEGKNIATVFLVECPLTSYPLYPFAEKPNIPVAISGTDRGNSVAFNLAYHPKTRFHTYVGAIERDRIVSTIVEDYRAKLSVENECNWQELLRGDIQWVVDLGNGEEEFVSQLPEELQKAIIRFVVQAMASPKAIIRNDWELQRIESELYEDHIIESPTEKRLFQFIQKQFGFPDQHFRIISNAYFVGSKTYDLKYLLSSLAVRFHPQILEPILLSYTRSRGLIGGAF